MPEDKDHVVEVVLRLKAHDDRRVAVLLHDDGGRQRGFQAVHLADPDDLAERPQGGPDAFVVVSQRPKVPLDLSRRPVRLDDGPLPARERFAGRRLALDHGTRCSHVRGPMPAGLTHDRRIGRLAGVLGGC